MLSRITRIPSLIAWPLLGLSTLAGCDGGDDLQRSGLDARDEAARYQLIETEAALTPFATLDDAAIAALPVHPEVAPRSVDTGVPSAPSGSRLWLSDRIERPSCKTAQPTSTIHATLRLDAGAQFSRGAFDPLAPWQTAHAAAPMLVFGADSACVELTVYLRRVDDDRWRWWMLTDGRNLRGGTYGLPTEIGTGDLRFDATGRVIAQAGTEVTASLVGLMRPWVLHLDFAATTMAFGPSKTERVLFDGCYETGSEACL
ncbi:MAG: hypothetical protein R3F39_21035 [Myxococcota bacterium]